MSKLQILTIEPHTLTAGAKMVDGIVTYPGQPTLFNVS